MRTVVLDLASLAAVAAAVGALGAFLYLAVSFRVMRRHTEPRGWGAFLRAFIREVFAIAWTQPLLPLYYFIGRRMGGPREGRPIILVHGYFQNRADFVFLAHVVARAKLGPIYGFNYDWRQSIARSASRLARFVEDVCQETGAPKVAIVAHSLGGVVALEYLSTPEGAARVDRCVTIASPHAGVLWGGIALGASARELRATSEYMRTNPSRALAIPTLSIYSSHDNIVHPSATSGLVARGGEDELIEGVGHLGLLFSRVVADATVRALSTRPGRSVSSSS
jgi:pimeloyl-ACP methyl ester carboxylesterase